MNGWDGGWEEEVDSGEGVEDLVLGPAHPYGRSTNDQPAHRRGTRHEIVSKRFADPADSAKVSEGSDGGTRSSSSFTRRRPSAGQRGARTRRKVPTHVRVGVERTDLRAFEGLLAWTERQLPPQLAGHNKRAELAVRLGLTVQQLDRYYAVLKRPSLRAPDVIRHFCKGSTTGDERLPVVGQRPTHRPIAQLRSAGCQCGSYRPKRHRKRNAEGLHVGEAGEADRSFLFLARNTRIPQSRRSARADRQHARNRHNHRGAPSVPTCQACGSPISVNGFCGCS